MIEVAALSHNTCYFSAAVRAVSIHLVVSYPVIIIGDHGRPNCDVN